MAGFDKSTNQKLARFGGSIMKTVEERCAEIRSEIEDFRETELSKYEHALKISGETDISAALAALEGDVEKQLSGRRIAMRQNLFQKRNAYALEIFTAVEKNLHDFSLTDAYRDFLLSKAAVFASECKAEGSVIKLRKEDMVFAQEMKSAYGMDCTVEAGEAIKLGGAMLINENESIIIDETLDNIFENQKDSFYAQSGFSILF